MTAATYRIIGSNGDTIVFDNTSYSVMLDELQGLSGYTGEYDTTAPPGFIGEIVNSTVIRPRALVLHVTMWGNGRGALELLRDRLINALNPLLGISKLVWTREDGKTYVLHILPNASPEFTTGTDPDAKSWDCILSLISHDPCWYADTPEVITIVGISGGFALPFDFPFDIGSLSTTKEITNDGSAPCPVLIELYGQLTMPIVIENLTTGESITVRKTINAGEKLTIDTSDENLHVTFTDANGNSSNALNYCTVGSVFWQLKIGLNRIRYNVTEEGATASGTITITKRWLAK